MAPTYERLPRPVSDTRARVADGVAVVGVDGLPDAVLVWMALGVVAGFQEQLGDWAAERVLDSLDG